METLLTNAATRHEVKVIDGKTYLVCQCVMIREGVHAGSKGPIFYSANALQASVADWNFKPVTILHPKNPDVLLPQSVGFIANTRLLNGKLIADLWLEQDRLGIVDARVLNAVKANKTIEVSTGLYLEHEQAAGNWQGKSYVAKANKLIPHHLAILPDVEGACSRAAGCGLNVSNQQGENVSKPNLVLAQNQSKHLALPTWEPCCSQQEQATPVANQANQNNGQTPVKHLALPVMNFTPDPTQDEKTQNENFKRLTGVEAGSSADENFKRMTGQEVRHLSLPKMF